MYKTVHHLCLPGDHNNMKLKVVNSVVYHFHVCINMTVLFEIFEHFSMSTLFHIPCTLPL